MDRRHALSYADEVQIIAHRGASYDAPENTLAAIRLAWDQGADAVEIDVHLSKDGRLAVIHDPNTRKITGVRKLVRDQTLAELRGLDAGRWKDTRWAGECIPELSEVLAILPDGKRLFVEIKCGPECLSEFRRVLRLSGKRRDQVIAIGFDLETMAAIKRTLPPLEVCWIAEFKRSWKTARWLPLPETLIQKAKAAGLDGLALGVRGPINLKLAEKIRAARLKFYLWTVDSPAKANGLLVLGVDGIATNRPGWLRARLKALAPS